MALVAGLSESVRGEWSGDIDLSDGQLQLHYQGRLWTIKGIGLKDGRQKGLVVSDLEQEMKLLEDDLDFVVQSKLTLVCRMCVIVTSIINPRGLL